MILQPTRLHRSIPSYLLPFTSAKPSLSRSRCLHQQMSAPRIPSPTPFVPDTQTFLSLIGRNLSQHAAKIPSWEALFSLTSGQLRELGVEPPRSRRYLLRWRERFRKGQFGIGGDMKEVVGGTAEVRIVEVSKSSQSALGPTHLTSTLTPGGKRIIVNLPNESLSSEVLPEQLTPLKGIRISDAQAITGPYVQLLKGGKGRVARISVKEGLWEDRRGRKVDGGERRQAEVRAKRRSAEKNIR